MIGDPARPAVPADGAQFPSQLGEAEHDRGDEEGRERQQAPGREDARDGLVDPQRRAAVGVRLAQAPGHRVRQPQEGDVGRQRHRDGRDAEPRDQPALQRPDGRAGGHRGEDAEDRGLRAGLDGEHAAQRVGPRDRQVELARDHRDPEREGEEPQLGEALQRVVDVEGLQGLAAQQRRGHERGKYREQRGGRQ
jgi:hypothetical protein